MHARTAIVEYIEIWYNRRRPHTCAGGQPLAAAREAFSAYRTKAAQLEIYEKLYQKPDERRGQAESFNAAVKVEQANRTRYPTRQHAMNGVDRYIKLRSDQKRTHLSIGYLTSEPNGTIPIQ